MDVATQEAKQWIPTWKKVECPDIRERGCHSTILMGDLLIAFGGWDGSVYFNDIVALDLRDMKWQKANIIGENIIPRYTHSANLFQGDKIVVVGGYSGKHGVLNETALLSLVSKEPLTFMWKILDMKTGEKPYRSDHTANIHGNYLYMFGGADKREESVDELWLLNLGNSMAYSDKFTWTRLSTSSTVKPGDRYGHCSVLYNEALYIFGGFSTSSGKVLDDLWMLSLRELKWQKADTPYQGPSARTAASVQEVDGKIILFGGYSGIYSNELFSFDINTQKWEKLPTKGELPRGRAYHSAVYYQGQYIVWGGEIAHQRCTYSLYSCQLEESNETLATKGRNEPLYKEKKALKTLETIFINDLFADVIFEVEEQEIPAHRAILAGGSQYFNKLLTRDMNNTEKIKIKVSDVKAITFKAFLRFLYCQTTELEYSLAIDLLGLSEQYADGELKEFCEDYLSKGLNHENIIELTNVAECFEAANLKHAVAKFKQKNNKL